MNKGLFKKCAKEPLTEQRNPQLVELWSRKLPVRWIFWSELTCIQLRGRCNLWGEDVNPSDDVIVCVLVRHLGVSQIGGPLHPGWSSQTDHLEMIWGFLMVRNSHIRPVPTWRVCAAHTDEHTDEDTDFGADPDRWTVSKTLSKGKLFSWCFWAKLSL